MTNKDADFRKVIYIDIDDKNYSQQEFIQEGKFLLESVIRIGDYFCAVTSENVVNRLALFDNRGKFDGYILAPSTGKISFNRINQNSDTAGNELFFSFTNFFNQQQSITTN